MATPGPRRRKSAVAAVSDTVKTSLVISRDLHIRLQVAASMKGISANAFAVECLSESLHGIIIHDRRKNAGPVGKSDRLGMDDLITSDDEEAA